VKTVSQKNNYKKVTAILWRGGRLLFYVFEDIFHNQ